MTTVYNGDRTIDGPVVLRNGEPLDPRVELAAYSSQGLDWGSGQSPSHQLAFALLMDHLGDAEQARDLVPRFAAHVVARLDNEWEFDSDYVGKAIAIIQSAMKANPPGPERFE